MAVAQALFRFASVLRPRDRHAASFIYSTAARKREGNENFASTASQDHALNHADAAEAIRHSAFQARAAMHGPDRWQTRIANLF
ncbi:hypothetical protein [Paraburkholderia tropica]|uniref:hypothetical protein n=1 Tax=Paraburkholderia tropica TaxID=92647 RepID=UPI000F538D9E|nr:MULTISPECIES: hypothetical protein [Paraburkholderia]MBB2979197.1 hypothetical protein [Paraburkholderia tropica]QNB12093.1 hypothetical protein G5S35_11290 [Paraburkholderia tropica]RQM49767.1 hypothetical protein EHZ19_05070 [Paraburkholderia bannensis]RQN41108.1 hypothetical protein EHZ25_02420 [Paraburkholderia tropica]